jgi:hypothetical protein
VSSVQRLAAGWTTEGSQFESQYGKKSYLLHVVQPGSGVHPASYPVGNVSCFPRLKRAGREADHSTPTSAEVKKMWIHISTPTYTFMV